MSRFLLVALLVVGAFLLSQGLYLEVKARLAQVLIASSWEASTADRPPPKPWWWADTRPIAKLEVPRLHKSVYVMQDDSGESLAFGPGHMPSSALPGNAGHVAISGHRDSHFEFLKDIQVGDIITTTRYDSASKRYRVVEAQIIDTQQQSLSLETDDRLTLITCYPFDGLVPGGSLRYVLNAEEI